MQTSFAANAVLNKLNEHFANKNFLFAEFYDFERGLEPYFKRRLSQVPIAERGKDWVSIMWSRDPILLSYQNKEFMLARYQDITSSITGNPVRYVFCSIIFTYISNSMDYLENMEKYLFKYVPDGFSVMFKNMPYPEWNASKEILLNSIHKPRINNNLLYRCIQAGISGDQEPEWSRSDAIQDGSVVWKAIEPDEVKVRLEDVACSGLQKFSLDTDDSLCKIDIGGRMYYPIILEDIDPDTGLVTGESANMPRILYPRADVISNNTREIVTPTPDHEWSTDIDNQ